MPARICGTTHLPSAKGVKAVPPGTPPFVNAQKVAPCAGELRDKTSSALMLEAELLIVMAGSGLMFRFEPEGQEEMKPAARVKTFCTPRGVSNADGTATALAAVRMNVWWRASTVTISAATVRIAGLETKGAAPRYLEQVSGRPRGKLSGYIR